MPRNEPSPIVPAAPSRRALIAGAGVTLAACLPSRVAAGPAPLTVSDQHAIMLWRERRAALAKRDAIAPLYEAARNAIPAHLLPGPRFIGRNLSSKDAAVNSAWPAIVGMEPPEYGSLDVRPDPLTLWSIYCLETTPRALSASAPTENAAEAHKRAFDRFALEIAALAERLAAQHEAEQAVDFKRLDREADDATGEQCDIEGAIHDLDCNGAHALAAIVLLRWSDEMNGQTTYDNPNSSFYRNVIVGLLPSLTGELAEDAAAALARDDEEARDEDPRIEA